MIGLLIKFRGSCRGMLLGSWLVLRIGFFVYKIRNCIYAAIDADM